MEKEEYIREIELIETQNNTEYEIYPLAVEIIQPTTKALSKRYIFARQRSRKGNIYFGLSSFPDVAIIDKQLENIPKDIIQVEDWLKLKGCLEIKALGNRLLSGNEIQACLSKEVLSRDEGQLIGEILWYKNVLYTNGIEWRYLHVKEYTEELIKEILNAVNERIAFEKKEANKKQLDKNYQKKEYDWWSIFKSINFMVVDECITEDCEKDWDEFIVKIKKIKWD